MIHSFSMLSVRDTLKIRYAASHKSHYCCPVPHQMHSYKADKGCYASPYTAHEAARRRRRRP
jgi:hypothetical protein